MVDEARSGVSRNDVVQFEVVSQNVRNHISVSVDDTVENIFPAFENHLDRLVQSNDEIVSDENIELIVRVVRNPGVVLNVNWRRL